MDNSVFNEKTNNNQFRKLQIYSIIFLVINEIAWYYFYGRTQWREFIVFPIFLYLLYSLKLAEFKMPKFKKTDIFIIIGGYLAVLTCRIIILMIKNADIPANQQALENAFTVTGNNLVLVVFMLAIVAPIQEELLYRKLIIGNVFRKMPLLGVFVSSILFGAGHMIAGFSLLAFIDYSLTGLIFGLIYYKTRRLEVSIATHMVNNTMSAILLLTSI